MDFIQLASPKVRSRGQNFSKSQKYFPAQLLEARDLLQDAEGTLPGCMAGHQSDTLVGKQSNLPSG